MKKRLEPLQQGIPKSQASYQMLMLDMMSKLVNETRENSALIRQMLGTQPKTPPIKNTLKPAPNSKNSSHHENPTIQKKEEQEPAQHAYEEFRETFPVPEFNNSNRRDSSPDRILDAKLQKILTKIDERLQSTETMQSKFMEKLDIYNENAQIPASNIAPVTNLFPSTRKSGTQHDLGIIEKALMSKTMKESGRKNYAILSEILPYSDRRELKVKFKLSDIIDGHLLDKIDLSNQTSEWLGNVYRATASICWNMLLNSLLTFEEVKILFTENIVFNFIAFMNQLKTLKNSVHVLENLTQLINKKSCDILDFLCKQYPQTKIEAPNVALRELLPQIDNQGRVKYDLVSQSGIIFTYNEDKDYTSDIMREINFMIDKSNEQFEGFRTTMREIFEEVYLPIHKRGKNIEAEGLTQQDMYYKDKVKSYTKYLIGRKIAKNTLKYSEQQIQDGIFFVKSTAVLRVITKWVEQLRQYFSNSQQKIKNSYSQSKDHFGRPIFLSSLLKNGIHKRIMEIKGQVFTNIQKIKKECYVMELLLTNQSFTTDETQVHLNEQQIMVGKYCSNLKSAISAYICSQLNELIHYLLKVPKEVDQNNLGLIDVEDIQAQARKDLSNVNLVSFKLFDLLRCKCHSNQDEIIWIVKRLLQKNKNNKDSFEIIRIKDRLSLGTRDIMINAQINKGMPCQIQLSVTSNADKKQQLLDSYNHFLYQLKRSTLGPITENVSIWATLQQRFSYFQQLITKNRKKNKGSIVHNCDPDDRQKFTRPIICQSCNNFFAIPQTCLLNIKCNKCQRTFCGECYYATLDPYQRKQYIFEKERLLKRQVLDELVEYTDPKLPFPQTGFFIKKKFLKKELAFYMAIQKKKEEKQKEKKEEKKEEKEEKKEEKDGEKDKEGKQKQKEKKQKKEQQQNPVEPSPAVITQNQLIIVQTIIRSDFLLNRQVNRKDIQAQIKTIGKENQFYVKNYHKTEMANFIIFSFKSKKYKQFITLNQLEHEMSLPENRKMKILSLVKEPSYISKLTLFRREIDKKRELNSLRKTLDKPGKPEDKITAFRFKNLIILAQVLVKGGQLRAQITSKVNISSLKSFAYKESDIVSMEFKGMTKQMELITTKMKPFLYEMFKQNVKKLFLNNNNITSIECFSNFPNLQFIVISNNFIKSLKGVQDLVNLSNFRFDQNQVEDMLPLTNCKQMRYIVANKNKLKNLKGLQNAALLQTLSAYGNQIKSIEDITKLVTLQELYLRENPIDHLDEIKKLPQIQKLFLGNTDLKHIPNLNVLSKLKSLSLQGLQLTQIPSAIKQIKLQQLWLNNNNITKITNLQNQTQLVLLNLKKNKITKIQNLEYCKCLQVLKLQNNKITVIKGLKKLMESLKIVNLKQNPIDDIHDLLHYEYQFQLLKTDSMLTENAKKQFIELGNNIANFSSGDD